MQGDPDVLEVLNDCLAAELTAINQYFGHAKLFQHWGYKKLADFTRSESMDEMRHAEELIERILYLDGHPNLQRLAGVKLGENVPEAFRTDLEFEKGAIERLQRGVALARERGDDGSRQLLERMLVDEEHHADWLETQLHVIGEVGEGSYLAQQLG